MDIFYRWIDFLAALLATAGVPEAYHKVGAMALLYFLAIIVVLLVVFFIFRLGRKPSPPSAEERPEEFVEGATEAGEEVPPLPVIEKEEVEVEEVPVAPPLPKVEERVEEAPPPSLFERMRAGLARTHAGFVGKVDALLARGGKIDADLLEELEEILITADFGMQTTRELIGALEKKMSANELSDFEAVRKALRGEIEDRLCREAAPLETSGNGPFVIMVVGVNGVGKTTTIGKLAWQFAQQGKKVLLGAGDTFRAAAAEQLSIWGERAGVDVIRHDEGADPAAVAFDAAKAAVSRGVDILVLDTAGRLHTKVNLMEELKKIRRVLAREIPGAPQETLLVLDATTGQNALNQARLFKEAVDVSGIVLTKLDGTARGGIVVAIGSELGLPVKFIGIGESAEDLRPFDPALFAEALFLKD